MKQRFSEVCELHQKSLERKVWLFTVLGRHTLYECVHVVFTESVGPLYGDKRLVRAGTHGGQTDARRYC